VKAARGLIVHLVLLGVAGGLALRVFTRGEKPASAASEQQVQVWGGRPTDLKSLSYESMQDPEKKRVNVETRKDSLGRWYVVGIEKTAQPAADGGAPISMPDKPEAKKETTYLVSIKEGDKLTESLAPLMAMRALGKVPAAQLKDFGLDKPEATLRVVFDDKPRTLVVGGVTPSGVDRYARIPDSGEVYAVSGEFVRSLMFADSRLLEREIHNFEPGEVTRIVVSRGKNPPREFVKVEGKTDGWADAKTPAKLDETAGNWLSKVGRLSATQYFEQFGVPILPEYQVIRLEYFHNSKSIGFLELTRIPDNKSNAGYVAKTERTRWYAQVLKATAEQIDQDVRAVVGAAAPPAGGAAAASGAAPPSPKK
jgi:hypothetical protein